MTMLENETELEQQTEDPIFAHIIDRGDDKRPAKAIVLEARVLGIELTALCGHTWIPQRNPEDHPICPKCKEILEFAMDYRL